MLIQYTLDNDVATGDYKSMFNMVIILLSLQLVQSKAQYIHTNN